MEELKKQFDSMLAAGVIRPSKSPWGAIPVFVKKKTGEWRIALDYRPVNKQMTFDTYPLPDMLDLCRKAAGHKFYTAIDMANGFWNVELEEESRVHRRDHPLRKFRIQRPPLWHQELWTECWITWRMSPATLTMSSFGEILKKNTTRGWRRC